MLAENSRNIKVNWGSFVEDVINLVDLPVPDVFEILHVTHHTFAILGL